MTCKCAYATPGQFSDMTMLSDGECLTGLFFDNSPSIGKHDLNCVECDLPVFRDTRRWLDAYFAGVPPDWTPAFRLVGATPFRSEVAELMLRVPFGETVSYGDLALQLAKAHGIPKMSAQAVGAAVGWNPVCIIVPCHRVVGSGGNITGYGGGIENKIELLRHEGHDADAFQTPKQSAHWLRSRH